ncbi:integrase core domain-containing protein [Sediminispirochaeta smaragdinae]|uniref:integrase core domain-containing protein n=1 Tax=Sediminispirochaeta smaragdinae TaxID=55206 RepID=UPI0005A475CC
MYVERFCQSLKYVDIYLKSYESICELKADFIWYLQFYNSRKFHQSLDYRTPEEMYESFQVKGIRAAA